MVLAIFSGSIGGFGVTAGAHRYFTHRCFKANLPLRILLMLAYTSAGQVSKFAYFERVTVDSFLGLKNTSNPE